MRQTASRKTTGPDEFPAELFNAGETVLDRMHRICAAIWETAEWPEEWTLSAFIPLLKKGDSRVRLAELRGSQWEASIWMIDSLKPRPQFSDGPI